MHALVTGASSGIGAAIATRLLADQWRVTGLDLVHETISRPEELVHVVTPLGFGFADRAALKIAGDFGKLIAVDRDFAFAHILRRRGGVRPQGAQQQPEDKPRQARKCEEENYFIRRKQHGDRLSPGFEMAPV